jgi:hypothetical protein
VLYKKEGIPGGDMKKLIPLFLIIISSCIFDSNTEYLSIEMDKDVYKKDEIAKLTIKNYLKEGLILYPCHGSVGYEVEKYMNGIWIQPYSLVCATVDAGPPFYIGAGKTLQVNLSIHLLENYLDQIKGIYRLKLWLSKTGTHDPIPDELRRTKPFNIVLN